MALRGRGPLHLADDDPVVRLRRLGNGKDIQIADLPLHGDIAVRIGRRSPEEADINLGRSIEKILLAVDRHHFGNIFCGAGIHFPAAVARIAEGPEPRRRQNARLLAGCGAE